MTARRRIRRMLGDALRGRRPAFLPQGDTFLRGLALGALVGAAIAGSTIWSRIRGRREPDARGDDRG